MHPYVRDLHSVLNDFEYSGCMSFTLDISARLKINVFQVLIICITVMGFPLLGQERQAGRSQIIGESISSSALPKDVQYYSSVLKRFIHRKLAVACRADAVSSSL